MSNHVALGVNQNVRVLIDGSDSLALFQSPSPSPQQQQQSSTVNQKPINHHVHHRKKFTLHQESNKANVCHFYTSMECLEDVSVSIETGTMTSDESKTQSNIYAANSCDNQVKKFVFERGQKVVEERAYQFGLNDGTPISVVANQLGHLFVLTDLPRRLLVIDQRECSPQ